MWRAVQVPGQGLAQRARGSEPELLGHALDRVRIVLEVMHGQEQATHDETIPWRAEAGAAEAVLERPSLDATPCRGLRHGQWLLRMLQGEAEGG